MVQSTVQVLMVGAGPRTVAVLERLAANAPELLQTHLEVHLVDPFPAGSGRVWRHEQHKGLLLNSLAKDITLFPDDSVQCLGPTGTGPDLVTWVEQWRSGSLDPQPGLEGDADPALRAELSGFGPASFPSRRLFGEYVRWTLTRAVAQLGGRASVHVHTDTVLSVQPHDRTATNPEATSPSLPPVAPSHTGLGAHPRYRAALASGRTLAADLVFFSLGHGDSLSSPRERSLAAFAAEHGASYFPPAYTADVDYSEITAGQDVLVSGMGLAFIDVLVLLFQGRGGSFAEQGDSLVYRPSGREPKLWVGSRRGVPYHAKPQAPLLGPGPAPGRYFTNDYIQALLRAPGQISFDRDLWPVIAKDVLLAHYREVLAAPGAEPTFNALVRAFDAHTVDSPELAEAIEAAIPEPRSRLDLGALDRPLQPLENAATTLAAREAAVAAHVREDLQIRGEDGDGATTALFSALLMAFGTLAAQLPGDRLSATSQHRIRTWFNGFFSFVDSGPPPRRLRELLALHDAGLVRFLGPGLAVQADPGSGGFLASVPGLGPVLRTSALIEARLPDAQLQHSQNPALQDLIASGLGREAASAPGFVDVDAHSRLVAADGSSHAGLFAGGPWTSAWGSVPFARPGTNAPGFRVNDELSRSLLIAANGLAGLRPGTADMPALLPTVAYANAPAA